MKKQKKNKTINQILVTESSIVTPEMKRKRKIYKFNFFLFSFLACTLFTCCIYAEYDRNRSEEVSQGILLGIQQNSEIQEVDDTTISMEDGVLIINALESGRESESNVEVSIQQNPLQTGNSNIVESTAPDGKKYYTEAVLKIASLGIEYPVLSDSSEELLKISLNRIHGPSKGPNEVGNYVIAGHNYKSGKMFGKLPNIKIGDIVELTDLSGRMIQYKVYKKYIVDPTDVSCTSQHTNGKREITLITCTNNGEKRHIIKAEAI